MPALHPVMFAIFGLAVGLALAWLHAHATRRAAASALAHASSARLLLGFPIRVVVPAAALFGLARLDLWALLGALLAFIVGQRLALAQLDRQTSSEG
jgi:hypothetical protein